MEPYNIYVDADRIEIERSIQQKERFTYNRDRDGDIIEIAIDIRDR